MKKHSKLKREQREAYNKLKEQTKLTTQEYKTFKGLIFKNDIAGFYKGLEKVLARKE